MLLELAIVLFSIVAVATVPMLFGNRTLEILSGSMEPSIATGAAVVAQPVVSQELQVGDVIVFSPSANAELSIVHRIVSIREHDGTRFYVTQGDANKSADATEVSLPSRAWRVWYSVPLAGYVIAFALSRTGTVLLILIPLAALFILSAADWLRRKRQLVLPAFIS